MYSIAMSVRKTNRYSVLFVGLVCFLTGTFRKVNGDPKTFINTTVEWCDNDYSNKICENTTIQGSNSLVANIPVNRSDIKYVNMWHQNIPVLYKDSITNVDLHTLTISKSGIREIDTGAFCNVSLINLKLNDNKLEKLRSGIFKNVSMYELELAANRIKVIEKGAFEGIPHLGSLNLERNQLEDITGIFDKSTFETILLGGNNIKTITKQTFQHVPTLQILDISDNKLTFIEPGSFSNLKQPVFMYLHNNLLENISEGVFNSIQFVQLIVTSNKIKTISPGAFKDSSFAYLNLIDNNITEITRKILKGCYIEYLNLEYNEIQSIEPHALDNVTRGVQLESNDLEVIKEDTFKFARIVVLLKNPRLKKIEERAFNDDNITVIPFYSSQPRTIYLEKQNGLDEESKNYLQSLTQSGFLWYDKITTNLLFPLT